MSLVKGMPCHITAMGDEPEGLLDERDGTEETERIAKALLNGDKFQAYGRYMVDFSNVVDDELACNPEFANALRKLINAGEHMANSFEAAQELIKVANKAVDEIAESIYESRG